MGKSTISMAIFNSYVSHYQRVNAMEPEPCLFELPKSAIDKAQPQQRPPLEGEKTAT
jgi:hypothetical protein